MEVSLKIIATVMLDVSDNLELAKLQEFVEHKAKRALQNEQFALDESDITVEDLYINLP